MSRVKVSCQITTYNDPAVTDLRVHSHWNDDTKVDLEHGGIKVTVVARDLITAIENCTHTNNR